MKQCLVLISYSGEKSSIKTSYINDLRKSIFCKIEKVYMVYNGTEGELPKVWEEENGKEKIDEFVFNPFPVSSENNWVSLNRNLGYIKALEDGYDTFWFVDGNKRIHTDKDNMKIYNSFLMKNDFDIFSSSLAYTDQQSDVSPAPKEVSLSLCFDLFYIFKQGNSSEPRIMFPNIKGVYEGTLAYMEPGMKICTSNKGISSDFAANNGRYDKSEWFKNTLKYLKDNGYIKYYSNPDDFFTLSKVPYEELKFMRARFLFHCIKDYIKLCKYYYS